MCAIRNRSCGENRRVYRDPKTKTLLDAKIRDAKTKNPNKRLGPKQNIY